MTNALHTASYGKVLQSRTVVESGCANRSHPLADHGIGQCRASMESMILNCSHAVRNGHTGQSRAPIERIRPHGGDAVRNGHTGQGRPSGKGVGRNALHHAVIRNDGTVGTCHQLSVENVDETASVHIVELVGHIGGQRVQRTVGKGVAVQQCHILRDMDAPQGSTTGKGVLPQDQQAFRQGHLCQGCQPAEGILAHLFHALGYLHGGNFRPQAIPRCASVTVVRHRAGSLHGQNPGFAVKSPGNVPVTGSRGGFRTDVQGETDHLRQQHSHHQEQRKDLSFGLHSDKPSFLLTASGR